MPEFKEEIGQSSGPDVRDVGIGDERKASGRVHYNLKRGRIPAQKKSAAAATKSGVREIDASAVQSDAIGVGGGCKEHCAKKSTEVVEKDGKNKRLACACSTSKSGGSKKEEACSKICCRCKFLGGFFKKFLHFFGLCKCKKDKQPEKQVRSYRQRRHNQRRRRPQSGVH